MTPLGANPNFGLGLQLEALRRWYEGGCKRVGYLFDEQGVIPFDQIRETYGLTEADRMMYNQIRHWAMLPANRALIDRPLTPFEKWIVVKKDDKRVISELSGLLRGEACSPKTKGQQRWERELERELSDEE
ncbi:hypothetical protein NDU88_005949 [Pleurodeles waltl]|uniref:Uncharacterized protein n=1 Tax=Pleurodeles waltl TaxID=8319 RepID=A0AAV7WDA5_PLEWA|nr:hypothetical protein NDU88_005949 [Pleurodeles waltl]